MTLVDIHHKYLEVTLITYENIQKANWVIFFSTSQYALKLEDFGERGGQNHPKWPKKWYFLTSVTKRVLGSIKRLSEYDIEYYGTPSGSYGLVPTCPQHTSRGGAKIFFAHFFCQKTWFFSMIFQKIGAREVKNCRKIEKKFTKFINIFQKIFKKCEILKIFGQCTFPTEILRL